MIKVILTESEQHIIINIAQSQIESYARIYQNDNEDIEDAIRRMGFAIERGSVDLELASIVEKYEYIKSKPELLFNLDADNLKLIADHLLNYADEYQSRVLDAENLYYKINLAAFCQERLN